jgi:hypothetical protein
MKHSAEKPCFVCSFGQGNKYLSISTLPAKKLVPESSEVPYITVLMRSICCQLDHLDRRHNLGVWDVLRSDFLALRCDLILFIHGCNGFGSALPPIDLAW